MDPTALSRLAERTLERCDAVAACSDEAGRVTRLFAGPAYGTAAAAVASWMEEAGMLVRRDAVGNVVGRWEPPDAPRRTLLLGSHLDSVRNAGRYDGVLGLLVAIAAVEHLRARGGTPPFAVEVAAFADEEGVRYGTAYLGSSALAGTFDPAWLTRCDADGIAMADAIAAAGGDPGAIATARLDPTTLLGYCEVHIEQGPVLEAQDLAVGVVTGIAGQMRGRLELTGRAGHAGTVPMELRHDALCAAAEAVLATEMLARGREGLVATVGELAVEPGASNVIPAGATLSLDVRHPDDAARRAACAELEAGVRAAAATRGVAAEWHTLQETPARACAPRLTEPLARAVAAAGHRVLALPSGAGHDAAALAAVTDVAMLFVRCAGGVSHDPAEAVREDDVGAAIDVLVRFVDELSVTA